MVITRLVYYSEATGNEKDGWGFTMVRKLSLVKHKSEEYIMGITLYHGSDKQHSVLSGRGVKRMEGTYLLNEYMRKYVPEKAAIFSNAIYLSETRYDCMNSKDYVYVYIIETDVLDMDKLYVADIGLSDPAIESAFALHDFGTCLEGETVADIVRYADSLVPYADYIKGDIRYTEPEFLYTGDIEKFCMEKRKRR